MLIKKLITKKKPPWHEALPFSFILFVMTQDLYLHCSGMQTVIIWKMNKIQCFI